MEPKYLKQIKNFRDLENKYPSSVTTEVGKASTTVSSLLSFDDRVHPSSQSINTNSQSEVPAYDDDTVIEYPKKEFKKLTWNQDSYEGTVISNNLHGSGFYSTQKNGEKYFYDGLFYINKLEGYCQVFYENGTHFQGLFKDHLRYGPGILTYPDSSQDVGFWNGFRLIRLACVVDYDVVPTVASTRIGKTKLLSSRYMVPLCTENDYVIKNTLEISGNDDDAVSNLDAIFNLNIRNPNSQFFHKNFYDEQFFGGQDCMIKVLLDDHDAVEEENDDKQEDDISVARADSLKSKIQEVNESLETFVVIKRNITHRINVCKSCCESEHLIEAHEASNVFEDTEHIETKPNQMMKDDAPLDGSLGSFEIVQQSFDDAEVAGENSSISTSPDNLEGICVCEEYEDSRNLQSLEEQLQHISTQETYYRNIRDELQKKLDRIAKRKINNGNDFKYKLVKVKELWAWNNEDSLVQVQKHCFKHRYSEDMVNFSVSNLILGNRNEFAVRGKHENMCLKFLSACGKGDVALVKECLRSNSVHPNIADAKGNSGIFFAAAKKQQDIIKILKNYGVKLDQLNDEQLTPLSMCFLKYIALLRTCGDWETAFLPESQESKFPDLPKWYDVKSFLSVTSSKQSTGVVQEDYQSRSSNVKYVYLNRRMSSGKPRKGSIPRSIFNRSYVFDLNCDIQSRKQAEEVYGGGETELEPIRSTIVALLNCGANPNACEVPYPPLVLALFTESPDLVKQVIKANADINVLVNENMSCLHIVASLKPCLSNVNMCMVLVKYGYNSNHRTLPDHWEEKRHIYTGNLPENFEIEDMGKNALHLLCMRTDFQDDQSDYFSSVAKLLLDTNIDLSINYLGHTPLSLAVLSGNTKLAQYLIESNSFDPYKYLEYGMGNVMTLFSLTRFENTLPTDQCKAVLTALFDVDVNVLQKVNDAENAIVFAENGDNFFDQFIQKEASKTSGKEKAKPKPKKIEKHSQGATIIEHLKTLGRQTIVKKIQMNLTQMMYEFVEEDMLENYEICTILASEYLTPEIVVDSLFHLFQSRTIEHDRLDHDVITTLLEFVNLHKKVTKKNIPKGPKKEKDKMEIKRESEETMETMARKFDITQNSKYVQLEFVTPPGLDDSLKYNICFHCLKGIDKELKSCPRCQVIRFCSAQCNKLNIKLKTQHGCNILFYDMTDQQITDISKGLCLDELVHMVREKCIARWQEIREAKLIQKEEKLLELWRDDIYGTKFLKMKPLLGGIRTETKGKQLKLNIGLLKDILARNFQKNPGDVSIYSLENLLMKLHGIKKSEGTLRTRQSYSTRRSTLGGSTLCSAVFDTYDLQEKASNVCLCQKKRNNMDTKTKNKPHVYTKKKEVATKKFNPQLISYMDDEHVNKFQHLVDHYHVQENANPVVKKLKTVPDRYQRFIEVIGTYFPDIDFSFWLLPYACCSDGQLYYRFCDNDIFKESYSFS